DLLDRGGNGKKPVERRSHVRLEERAATSFVDESGRLHECSFLDISAAGLCITTEARLHPGDIISFVSPACNAEVRWVDGTAVGLRFV
ncbi:MAG TPA: PilZ domain-containing protein, partial [Dissulfurispiraceae bacterium]|nr:PilZ domain-containing protein [Dissulfurispiraceae bacterium]